MAHVVAAQPAETGEDNAGETLRGKIRPWARQPRAQASPGYAALLEEGLSRLDHRDPSHRASLDLILTELDRLPEDENLWLHLASRLSNWNLDDELGPRFERALKRFQGPGIWDKARPLRRGEPATRLSFAPLARARGRPLPRRGDLPAGSPIPVICPCGRCRTSPGGGGRVRLVLWADWVRLKALERFPHSPTVVREASAPRDDECSGKKRSTGRRKPSVITPSPLCPDSLM